MPENRSANTKRIALNGIVGALAVIAVFFATVLPTNRLSFFVLSSFFVCIIIIEQDIRNGWAFYIATSLLALVLIPNKIEILPYVMFFGIYGIIKSYLEKINKKWLEYILKYLYFNFFLTLTYLIIKEFFILNIKIDFPWWVVIIILQFVFIIYDYVYTLFARYYIRKIKKYLNI